MKRTIHYFSLCLLLSITACGDTLLDPPIQNTENFFKLYGSYHNDYLNAMRTTSDYGYVMAGYTQDAESLETWGYISKILPTGMVEWDSSFINQANSKAFDVNTVSNDQQIALSCSQRYSKDSLLLYLLIYSQQGVLEDSVSSVQVTNEILDSRIAYQDDGTIKLLSHIKTFDQMEQKDISYIVLHEYIANTELKEINRYKFERRLSDNISIKYYDDDKLFMAATVYESEKTDGNSPPTNVLLMCIDEDIVLWENYYGVEGESETCGDFIINGETLVLTGNHKTDGSLQQIYLLVTDLFGNNATESKIVVRDESRDISCASLTINSSNNYVFCGDIATGNGNQDILFLETNQNGEYIRHKTYGSGGIESGKNSGKSIYYIPDQDSYFLSGQFEPLNNIDICVFKLNSNGEWLYTE